MIVLEKKIYKFDIKNVHFSDYPFDIYDCDHLEFNYCKEKVDLKGFIRKKQYTSIIDLNQDIKEIWGNIHKTSRRCIKKAEDLGISVRINEGYKDFYCIYKSFIKKAGISSFFNCFGIGIFDLDYLKKYGTLFVAEYDGEIICGRFYLEDASIIQSWVGASKRLDVDDKKALIISYANRLLHWRALEYAWGKNFKTYDFGGLWSESDAATDERKRGINLFKLSFGGERVAGYKYIKNYSRILKLLSNFYLLNDFAK